MIEILAVATHGSDFNLFGLIISIAFMGAVLYFFIMRPQRNRLRQQQTMQRSLEVGDEVMTSSGMYGTVKDIDEEADTVTVEIAPGTEVRMVTRAVSQRLVEPLEEDEDYSDEDSSEEESGEEEAGSQP
jgi:preprotein translocase subunit YajC